MKKEHVKMYVFVVVVVVTDKIAFLMDESLQSMNYLR